MYYALGLLSAGLIALVIAPAVWRRAERLSRARLEAAAPMTRAEIEAEKDQLRASFAITNRKLEMDTTRMSERLAGEVIELNRKRDEIALLTRGKAALTDTVARLEEHIAELTGALATSENKFATATAEIAARDARLAEAATAHAALQTNFGAAELRNEELRLELVARQTEIGNLKDSVAAVTESEAATAAARDRLVADIALERDRQLAAEQRAEGLAAGLAALQAERTGRIAELERMTAQQRALEQDLAAERTRREGSATEADALKTERLARQGDIERQSAAIAALQGEIAAGEKERQALAAEVRAREGAIDAEQRRAEGLARDLTAAHGLRTKAEGELQQRLEELRALEAVSAARAAAHVEAAEGDNVRKAMAASEAEKAELQLRLAAMEDDYAALRAENVELRRVAGPEWEAEREEARRLRERLNEVAAGVVRLGQAMTAEPAAPATAPATAPEEPGQSTTALADLHAVQGTRH